MTPTQDSKAPRLSPIDALHRASGAIFTEFAGWRLPLRFSGDLAEHRAVRESAGLFDVSHMGQIVVSGRDAASALAFALVSDVARLENGRARYTMMCRSDGGVIDDLIVYRIADDKFLVIANAANTEVVLDCLAERSNLRAVSIEDLTSERGLFSIQGPVAEKVVQACLGDPSKLPGRFHFRSALIAGESVLVARTGYTGEDGFEISVAASGAEGVWNRLLEVDGEGVIRPAGLAARDSLRLEAGLPLYGHELDTDRTPFAAGYGNVVDFGRSFVGDLALAQIAEHGPDEELVGLICSGQRSPRAGHVVRTADGQLIGTVTSGGPSPTLGAPIAMAYVNRSHSEVGSHVIINVRDRSEPAMVVPLPFYRRAKSPAIQSTVDATTA